MICSVYILKVNGTRKVYGCVCDGWFFALKYISRLHTGTNHTLTHMPQCSIDEVRRNCDKLDEM